MARFLIVGAAIAAAVQTFVPNTVVDRVASLPVLSLIAMMALAFLMSLCSESDAFVAASFVSFGPAAQLAFLVFGPMVDMKLAALYVGTYERGFLRVVIIAVGRHDARGHDVGAGGVRMTRWSHARVAAGLAIAAWAALFWFLLATDRTMLYLSTRTAWLVPMGAIIASVAAVGGSRRRACPTPNPSEAVRRGPWASWCCRS